MSTPIVGRSAVGSARGPIGTGSGELTVIYDGTCPLCRRCRRWVMSQSQLVRFRFVDAAESWVAGWLGHLVPVGDELVVVDQRGAVWVGADAFIVCLWGLERYRSLAGKLQRPGARPIAKRVFHSVSAGRGVASVFLSDDDLLRQAADREVSAEAARCGAGACGDRPNPD